MTYGPKQTTLFGSKDTEGGYLELINKRYTFTEALEVLDQIDWDFQGFRTQYLTHKFHSYPARFIPQIPLTFIRLFTKKGDTILDPFCGCGTTLVEAFLNERASIGNDFNPLATLISKVKTTLIPDKEFRRLKNKLAIRKPIDDERVDEIIEGLPSRQISQTFTRSIVSELEAIKGILLDLREHEAIFQLGQIALSATIRAFVENGSNGSVFDIFQRKIKLMQIELKKLRELVSQPPSVKIITGDARKLETIKSYSTDLVVTSPPYVNALDYYRIHMYNMHWLGMDFGLFRTHEIGAHSHHINNRFRLLSEYLGDMLRSMIEMNRVLKEGKLCVIVVGNSSLEYELIVNYQYFKDMSTCIGFNPIKTYFRNIDKTRKYTSNGIGKIDDEYILVLRKERSISITADNDDFVSTVVRREMEKFQKQIKRIQGTSIKGRKPTKERLRMNIERIKEAIEHIPEDIKIKS